jgi:hypothetical protein
MLAFNFVLCGFDSNSKGNSNLFENFFGKALKEKEKKFISLPHSLLVFAPLSFPFPLAQQLATAQVAAPRPSFLPNLPLGPLRILRPNWSRPARAFSLSPFG